MNENEKYKFECDYWCNFKSEEYDLSIKLDFTNSEYREDIDVLLAEHPECENVSDLIENEYISFIFNYDHEVGSRLIVGDYIVSVSCKGKEIPKNEWHEYL